MQQPKITGGYILLSRQLIESEIWDKPPLYIKVWVYLLTKAQHKKYKGLKRGQLYVSIPEIIEACSWYVGYRKEKPTKDQVFQIIDWLRRVDEAEDESDTSPTMITTTKATHGLLITIDNYSFYQDPRNYEGNSETNGEKVTEATREQRQHDNTNKNDKNVKNDKNKYIHDLFDHYLSKNIVKHAKLTEPMKKAVNARLKDYSFDELKKAIDNYSIVFGSDDYWFTHKYPFADFMRDKDVRKFVDEADPLKNFAKDKKDSEKTKTDHRDKEIEFQKWVVAGNDPEKFNWS